MSQETVKRVICKLGRMAERAAQRGDRKAQAHYATLAAYAAQEL